MFLTLLGSENIPGGVRALLMVFVSVAITTALYFWGGYLPAVFAQGIALYLFFFFRCIGLLIYALRPVQVFSFTRIFSILLVWFSGFFVLLSFRIFSRKQTLEKKEAFRISFHLSSLLFLFAYAMILFFLFFLQRETDLTGDRRLNLIPFQGAFAVYWPKILEGRFGQDIFIQFFGNLLILAPLGFYLGVYGRRMPKLLIFSLPAIFAGTVESTQYLFNMGASDIDDFWMNILGAWFGYFLFFLTGRIRKGVTDGEESSIF